MGFTKVAPAGIGTQPGDSITIGDSFLHTTGIDIGHNTGIGVTIRKHGDATFTGIITASAFFGDGSGLEGVASSGIGTPLSDVETDVLNKVYYVNKILSIGSTVTIDHPESGATSYTHYTDVMVEGDADLIVADGDTFVPDVLGISSAGINTTSAVGGRIRAGQITNAAGDGAPNFPNGITVTGVVTATTLNQNINGDLIVSGNVGIGGTLTYEDVTNIDSVGVITARSTVSIADSIVHIGDTNTSLRFPAADTITAETGGAERLRIDSDGKLILGTEIVNAGNANANISFFLSGVRGAYGGQDTNAVIFDNQTAAVDAGGTLTLAGFSGTTAISKAAIRGGNEGSASSNSGYFSIFTRPSSGGLTERLRIGSTGYVTGNVNVPTWFGRQDTAHNVSTATWTTIINLGNDVVNPSMNNSGWDESTGTFTVQDGQAGIYYVFGQVAIDDIQSDDIVRAGISKNDGTPQYFGEQRAHAGEANQIYQAYVARVLSVAVGDTIKLKVYHNEGTTEPTEPNRCYFGGYRLST
tara:strand:+ start:59 stop:1639 length:1581 start_codon:yes stop_codon:yes gene_type:complete